MGPRPCEVDRVAVAAGSVAGGPPVLLGRHRRAAGGADDFLDQPKRLV